MNYKVLAASGLLTVGLIAVGIIEATTPSREVAVVERMTTVDIAEPPADVPAIAASDSLYAPAPELAGSELGRADLAVPSLEISATPKIAYRYGFSFRLPSANLKALQERHADLCEQMGPTQCRILSMEQSDSNQRIASGSLQLAVAAERARTFGKQLATSAKRADGELAGTSIDGEDLSKDIVDTEARLRARIVLRDRLMEVLSTRRGSVKELVEAERGVAQVNEEIDQARSWLAEMRGRVQFSRVEIGYEALAATRSGFADPIVDAWKATGPTFGNMLALLLRLMTVLLPIGLIGWALFAAWKRAGRPGAAVLGRDAGPEPAEA